MINLEKLSISELNKKMDEIRKLKKKFIENCSEKVKN